MVATSLACQPLFNVSGQRTYATGGNYIEIVGPSRSYFSSMVDDHPGEMVLIWGRWYYSGDDGTILGMMVLFWGQWYYSEQNFQPLISNICFVFIMAFWIRYIAQIMSKLS